MDSKEPSPRDILEGASAPPAYEDIYPLGSQESFNIKVASAAQAAADAVEDEKLAAKFDKPTVAPLSRRGRTSLGSIQRPFIRGAHVPGGSVATEHTSIEVKRLRSDSRLFFIWVRACLTAIEALPIPNPE